MIISFVAGYYTNKIIGKKETKINENKDMVTEDKDDETKKEEIQQTKNVKSKLLYDSFKYKVKTEEFEYGGVTHKVNFKENKHFMEIMLDNKKVFEFGYGPDNIQKVYSLGDLIVVFIESSGIRGQTIEFIDFEGNPIKTIGAIEYNNFIFDIRKNDIGFVDNKIVLEITAVGEGPSLVLVDEISFEEDASLPYSEAFKRKYNITDETIIEAEYTFEYLGNNTFKEEMTDKITYKEFIDENF